jgi:hypothetical protein
MMGGYGAGMMWGGDAVAQALGMTAEEIAAEMRAGKSLADVAAAKGVSLETLRGAMLAEHKANLDQAVADGRLTAEQAQAMQTQMESRIQAMLEGNGAGPMGFGRGGMMGPGWQQNGTATPGQGFGPGAGRMGGYWQNQDGTQTPAPRMGPGMMGRAGIRG